MARRPSPLNLPPINLLSPLNLRLNSLRQMPVIQARSNPPNLLIQLLLHQLPRLLAEEKPLPLKEVLLLPQMALLRQVELLLPQKALLRQGEQMPLLAQQEEMPLRVFQGEMLLPKHNKSTDRNPAQLKYQL